MSILIELGGAIAGMLSEYAIKRRWTSGKVFFVPFSVFFAMAMIASFFYETGISLKMEIIYAFCLGLFIGFVFLTIYLFARKKSENHI